MRAGDTAVYVGRDGQKLEALIVAVTGSGASGYKTLNFQLPGGIQVTDVPHARDRVAGSPYWLQASDVDLPPVAVSGGHAAYDATAAAARGGLIDHATLAELEDVADAYGFNADAVKGTGAGGAVLKRDWLRELKKRRG